MKFIKKLFGIKPKIDWEEVRRSLEPKIVSLRKPTVRLFKSNIESKSKFGGRPLVESGSFIWPESNGKPMAFLAQLDLSEIAAELNYDWLSDNGMLLFFYDVLEMPWGFDPKDRGKWTVIYQQSPNMLAEYPESIDLMAKVKQSYITAEKTMILPDFDDSSVDGLQLSKDESDLYYELNHPESDQDPLHQVGGFPSPIQGNYMQLESQLASNGIYVGDPAGFESLEAKSLEAGANDWKLLFQFDGDDDLEVMWGDCGMLYFWVQEDKAKNNQFENCWLVLQCY